MSKLSNAIRNRLRKWLIPRNSAGVITLQVELEGYELFKAQLAYLERSLERVREKGEAVSDALEKVKGE